jgi:two-component system phosphate regulon sensor histidine kinase PhoR
MMMPLDPPGEVGKISEQRIMNGLHHHTSLAVSHGALNLQRTADFQAALLGMAGHDLRQPLQTIQTAYEWLGSRVADVTEKARVERGERAIARLAEQLDGLVNALRLYEHAQKMQILRVPLAPLFLRIASENEHDAVEKCIDMRVLGTQAAVVSNPVLLDGIVRNLVRNAVKYTRPGGRILIGCRRAGADMRIDIYDTGVGIAPEHLPQIFDAFKRFDTAHADGLGIGLFVVRRAVQLLGHRIDVRSVAGRGSRFSVFAPLA